MAEKRMFTQKIIDSDAFLDMPLSTQALYFHLNMRADDDGFINNPKRIQRTIGASEDDLKLLIAKRFVICFENGVIVIKHWRMHNTLRKDRYTPTVYQEQYLQLDVKDNNSYTEKPVNQLATTWQPDGNQLATQNRLDKNRLDKISLEEDSEPESDDSEPVPKKTKKPIKHKYGEYNNVLLSDEELDKLKTEFSDWQERIERLSSYMASTGKPYKNHLATIRNWAKKDKEQKPARRKEVVPTWMTDEGKNDMARYAASFRKTAQEDKELAERVEALKERLR